jgi:hypothetical protein
MSGEYREGDASILTDAGIITGQTPASAEHVAETSGVAGVVRGGEGTGVAGMTGGAEHPADIRSAARIIRTGMYTIGIRFWFLSVMKHLRRNYINGNLLTSSFNIIRG